jgi:hypothetical protein
MRPGLATALPQLRAKDIPLKRVFDNVTAKIDTWIKDAQVAA